jgi:hypothetical protein
MQSSTRSDYRSNPPMRLLADMLGKDQPKPLTEPERA